jgi:hypothetical protein
MKLIIQLLLLISFIEKEATEQVKEVLIIGKDTTYTDSQPLKLYLQNHQEADEIIQRQAGCMSTDCWRNYIGTWKIENDSLFLVGLQDCCDYKPIELQKVFPTEKLRDGKLFAHWFSSNVICDFGEVIGYEEDDIQLIFEFNYVVEVKNGKIKNTAKFKNEFVEDLE